MEEMNVKARDIMFSFKDAEDPWEVSFGLSILIHSEKSQEMMYSLLEVIDGHNLFKKGSFEILLGEELNAYPEYVMTNEEALEMVTETINNYEKNHYGNAPKLTF